MPGGGGPWSTILWPRWPVNAVATTKFGTPVFQPRTATASLGRTAAATCSVRWGGTWISTPLVRMMPSMSPIGVSVNALTVPVMSTCCPQPADAGGGGGDVAGAWASAGATRNAMHAPEMMRTLHFDPRHCLIREAGCHDFFVMEGVSTIEAWSRLYLLSSFSKPRANGQQLKCNAFFEADLIRASAFPTGIVCFADASDWKARTVAF